MSNYFYIEPIEVNVNLINTAPDPFPFKRFILDIGEPVVQLEQSISADERYVTVGEYMYISQGASSVGLDGNLITKKVTEPISAWRKLTNNTNAANLENYSYRSIGLRSNIIAPLSKLKAMAYVTAGGNRVEVTIEEDRITSYNTFPFSGYSNAMFYHPNIDAFTWPFEGGFGGQNFYLKRYGESTLSIDGLIQGDSYLTNSFCELDGFIYVFRFDTSIAAVKKVNPVTGATQEIQTVDKNNLPINIRSLFRLNDNQILCTSGNHVRDVIFDGSKFIVGDQIAYMNNVSSLSDIAVLDEHCIIAQGNDTDAGGFTLIRPDLSTVPLPLGSTSRWYAPRVCYDAEGGVHLIYCDNRYNFGIGRTYSRKIGRFEY